MSNLPLYALKVVRWTGWLLVPVVLGFFVTGYALSDRYGCGALMDERTALTLHKLMHLPLAVLVITHLIASTYLAFIRWGWIKPPTTP